MTALLVGTAASEAACRDRLDLVDDAFEVGPRRARAVAMLREHYCPHCPIEQACLAAGMAEPRLPQGGGGVWGATSANQRTRALNRRPHRRLAKEMLA